MCTGLHARGPRLLFPNRLVDLLEDQVGSVQVLNASRAGLDMTNNVRQLTEWGPRWRPHVAILYQLIDDLHVIAPLTRGPVGALATPPKNPSLIPRRFVQAGGGRGSLWRIRFNLAATMLLGGLWHGAALNCICWGAYHGAFLVLTRTFWHDRDTRPARVLFDRLLSFHLVVGGWLMFRVSDMSQFLTFVRGLGGLTIDSRLATTY